jgi:hexosaminidase
MRKLITAIMIGTGSLAAQSSPSNTLLPTPQSALFTDARLRLDSAFTLAWIGHRDARLEGAVERTLERLERRAARHLPRTAASPEAARLVIEVDGAGFTVPDLGEDESYQLEISATQARLHAATVVGAIRGLETLLQLHGADREGHFLQAATINDAPRFPWRGLLVDVARHFEPVSVIERIIDGMAALKLNVLHWHLSEDQGFRVESRAFPLLHQLGSDGLFYTQDEIRHVVAYAAERGIRVVPEFDVPGHTTAWLVGYPELGSAPGPYRIERGWGVFKGTMDPTRESTYRFLETFIAEMVPLFPDRSWHIGGDEVDPTHWRESEAIQAWMRANNVTDTHGLQTRFNERLFAILARHERQPVGWDEILQPDLPRGAVIQSWRGPEGLLAAAKQGRQTILSAPWYLDHIKTAGEMYLADVLPAGHDLAEDQQRLVLGGEAAMWSEYVTPETIESRIFPRLGAVAERFWSPAKVRDVPDMYRRLEVVSRQLAELGLRHEDHTIRMLRRHAGGTDLELLASFLDYARPKGFGGYGTNQLTPMTRLVDAARPDPWLGWRMQQLAAQAVSGDANATAALRGHFQKMQRFAPALRSMTDRVPVASEGDAVATALAELGALGEAALRRRADGTVADGDWRAGADSTLARTVGKRFGLLRPVGGEAVRVLVEGRGQGGGDE